MNNIPQIRFPEFVNEKSWNEKSLEQISPIIFDGTHQTPIYATEGIPFFSVENLISGNKNKFISLEDHRIATNKNKPEKGDILITRIGNIGFSKIIDWDYEFSIYVTLAVIKQSKEFNSYYLHSFFQSNYYQKEIRSKSLLSAVPCKINMNELRKTLVLIPPSLQEQKKIADCLSSLDELITGYEGKLKALQNHKKGMMQNLFPQEGKAVPNYRFPEFKNDDAWEVKTLNEVSTIVMGSSPKSSFYNENKIGLPLLQGNADIKNRLSVPRIYTSEITKECQINDILLGVRAPVGTVAKSNHKACIGRGIAAIRAKEDNSQELLYQWLMSFEPFWQNISQGGTFDAVNSDDIRSLLLPLPKPKEQQKIAKCLSSIDELIIDQTNKIEQLKLHKKGLMQGLFPKTEE
tara:strand:- start:4960 stop:6174 length:1215 start_codon:yes stop_codon:yes gene_type:complete